MPPPSPATRAGLRTLAGLNPPSCSPHRTINHPHGRFRRRTICLPRALVAFSRLASRLKDLPAPAPSHGLAVHSGLCGLVPFHGCGPASVWYRTFQFSRLTTKRAPGEAEKCTLPQRGLGCNTHLTPCQMQCIFLAVSKAVPAVFQYKTAKNHSPIRLLNIKGLRTGSCIVPVGTFCNTATSVLLYKSTILPAPAHRTSSA